MKIIFASRNKGKINEVQSILGKEFELISLLDLNGIPDIEETGVTFEENARIKAETVFKYTGIPSVGDDSGIEVLQLDKRPGVYSARYAGKYSSDNDNNLKLLFELEKFPEPHPAQFVCTAVFFDGNKYLTAFGEVKGRIIKEPRGNNGFGYDPLFLPDGFNKTTAELSLEEKNKISHRAAAFNKLKDQLLKGKI
ncbi:MAG: RdgB/HAM1 family non-canonical purine NTP pyrophosphatase [Ignavibacteriaceae bacterium]